MSDTAAGGRINQMGERSNARLIAARSAAAALADEIDAEKAERGTGTRRGGPVVALNTGFVRIDPSHPGNDVSPLVRIMGRSLGWRHGTAAKLYVLLLWRTASLRPHHATPLALPPARIGLLADTLGVTRRAVNDSLRHLDDTGFLRCEYTNRRGRNSQTTTSPTATAEVQVRTGDVQCLDDLGTRQPHQRPAEGEPWFALGPAMITEGWLTKLNGAAFAVLLVMASRLNLASPTTPIWVASTQVSSWYGFSHEVWKRGIDQLLAENLLRRYRPYDPESDVRDRRIQYSVEIKRDWLSPYADRVGSSPGFTPHAVGESSYSYRTAYIPALEVTPSRHDQLAEPEGPAGAGDPCQICTQPLTAKTHWVHKDRHVCSPACNHKLKAAAGLLTPGRQRVRPSRQK